MPSTLPPSTEGRHNALKEYHKRLRIVDGLAYSERREQQQSALKRQRLEEQRYQERFLRNAAKKASDKSIQEALNYGKALDALNKIDRVEAKERESGFVEPEGFDDDSDDEEGGSPPPSPASTPSSESSTPDDVIRVSFP